jgi:sec-independent protein translocase protein TatC
MPGAGAAASFWEHLTELRSRLVAAVIVLVGGFFVAWFFREFLFELVTTPVSEGLAKHGIYRLTAIETVEAIMVYLKLSLTAAVVITVPVALYQVWAFVKPGLTFGEIRPMRRIVVFSLFMFAIGLLFSYRIVLPLVIDYLTGFTMGSGGVDFQVTMKSAYSTALTFLLGFGIIFELPLVMVLLAATPFLDWRKYLAFIRYFIVLSFGIGSLLTPPDVLSQILMAVPISLLYVIGIGLSYFMEKKREEAEGQPVTTGFDPGMLLGAVLLTLPIVALVWPASVPVRAYLPGGVKLVATVKKEAREGFGCGALELDFERAAAAALEWSCASYPEGALFVADFDEQDAPDSACDAVDGENAAVACWSEGSVLVVGHPLLLTRFRNNVTSRHTDPGPQTGELTSDFMLFATLAASRKELTSYLSVASDPETKGLVHISLSFPDPSEAEDFAAALEAGEGQDYAVGAEAILEAEPLVEAVMRLADAVDRLAEGRGDAPEIVETRTLVQTARALAEQHTGASGRSGILGCTTPTCAYARLFPQLSPPRDIAANRRIVTFSSAWPDQPQRAAEVRKMLLSLL